MKNILLFLTLSAVGCCTDELYRKADRLTFDSISGEYIAYVRSDTTLDADQKTRRERKIRTWEARAYSGQPSEIPAFGSDDD